MGRKVFEHDPERPFIVTVADNYHYMDADEWYDLGSYVSAEAAVAAAKAMIDHELETYFENGVVTPESLYSYYRMFGPDPFISGGEKKLDFSAWDYAQTRCKELVAERAAADRLGPSRS